MPAFHPLDLCQPDCRKSCGACCGLYNWKDHGRAALTEILTIQTDIFFSLPDFHRLETVKKRRDSMISNTILFDTIYNCEFLGFLDEERRRIGCMLHPAVTGRTDLRSHCFYGEKICSEHFCPSYGCLTLSEQKTVVDTVDDWFLYGLVITDIDLVKEFFRHVEAAIGESIKPERVLQNPCIRTVLGEYFKLKEDWEFKAGSNRLGKYYFSGAEYRIAHIEYQSRWGITPSRFDKILVSLESDFTCQNEVRTAEHIIDDLISRCTAAYASS